AVCEGQKGIADFQADRVFCIELFQRDPRDQRILGVQQSPNHVVFRVAETRLVETHARGQPPENLHIWQTFSWSRQSGAGQLQVEVAVCVVEIRVFEERRHRQNDIGEIRGVRLELLQNNGE